MNLCHDYHLCCAYGNKRKLSIRGYIKTKDKIRHLERKKTIDIKKREERYRNYRSMNHTT